MNAHGSQVGSFQTPLAQVLHMNGASPAQIWRSQRYAAKMMYAMSWDWIAIW